MVGASRKGGKRKGGRKKGKKEVRVKKETEAWRRRGGRGECLGPVPPPYGVLAAVGNLSTSYLRRKEIVTIKWVATLSTHHTGREVGGVILHRSCTSMYVGRWGVY